MDTLTSTLSDLDIFDGLELEQLLKFKESCERQGKRPIK